MAQIIDIRIHAGAPSSRKDDDRYRELAIAYSSFSGVVVDTVTENAQVAAEPPRRVLLPPSSPTIPGVQMRDENVTIFAAEDPTFIDDTQLAYQALESQLQTSSIKVPQATPHKRPSSEAEDSPWPDQLPHGTFEVAAASADDEAAIRERGTSQIAGSSTEMPHPGKRRRLQAREVEASLFKPFKLPMKPTESLAKAPGTPKQAVQGRHRDIDATPHRNSLSQSSYLKTPILVTPKRARSHSEKPSPVSAMRSGLRASVQIPQEIPADSHPFYNEEGAPGSHLSEEYMALPVGSAKGLTYIASQRPIAGPTFHEPVQVSSHACSSAETRSELPTTYSLSSEASGSSKSCGKLSQRSSSDPGPRVAQEHSDNRTSTQRSNSLPPHTCEPARLSEQVIKSAQAEQRSVSEALVTNTKERNAQQGLPVTPAQAFSSAANEAEPSFPSASALPLAIRPPGPAVSMKRFSTHVTETLRYLAEESVVAKVFNPIGQARELRLLERGYWFIRTSAWPLDVQVQFWTFLENMVGSGKAGWGVWCVREPQQTPGADAELGHSLGDVKVFCWGEIAKHVYLMLYAASQSKVRKCGLQWIDAEDQVVIQMPCR